MFLATFKILLRAALDDDQQTVIKILDINPKYLLLDPKKFHIEPIQSEKTLQKFVPEKILMMIVKRRQIDMLNLLLPYFDRLENLGIIDNGNAQALEQLNIATARTSIDNNLDELFNPLISAILEDPFLERKPSQKTCDEIVSFRRKLFFNDPITLDNYFDIEMLLMTAYNRYYVDILPNGLLGKAQEQWYSVCIIGFMQSLVTPELAKKICHGLQLSGQLKDAVLNNSLAMAHQLRDQTPFYPHYSTNGLRLGSNFLVDSMGQRATSALLSPIAMLDCMYKDTNDKIKKIKVRLSQDSNQENVYDSEQDSDEDTDQDESTPSQVCGMKHT